MNGHHSAIQLPPAGNLGSFTIPLLDDEFDPDEMEILDHDETYLSHVRHPEEEAA